MLNCLLVIVCCCFDFHMYFFGLKGDDGSYNSVCLETLCVETLTPKRDNIETIYR